MSSKLKTDGDAFYLSLTSLESRHARVCFLKESHGITHTLEFIVHIGSFEGTVAFFIEIAGNKGSLGGKTIVRLRSL
jgi:hypothetical protein